MELIAALRKIRACEGEAAAQIVLEAVIAQAIATEREACAALAEEHLYQGPDFGELAREIRKRSNANFSGERSESAAKPGSAAG